MNSAQLLQTCLRNILRSRMRSLLTSLGVIIGVGSVIIMVAIGAGAQREIERRIAAMGTNLIQIMPRRIMMRMTGPMSGGFSVRANRITYRDGQIIQSEASYATAVSSLTQRNFTVHGSQGSASVNVMGVEPSYLQIRDWRVEEGSFFEMEDLEDRNRVAVLGATTAGNLLGTENPLGKEIRIGVNRFTVIGILARKGVSSGGSDQDDVIMVPLDTALTRLLNTRNVSSIAMSIVSKEYMEAAQREADLILREIYNLSATDQAHFEIMNQAEMIEMASETSRSLTTLLAAIAGVSLLVGGIGIMNIMLVSVTERTREIGIRMAVGARKRDILFQFLMEAVILSLMGGIIGVGMAFLVCRILNAFAIPTMINPFIVAAASIFAALVGIIFGYYPALKAAKLYPIDALRYE